MNQIVHPEVIECILNQHAISDLLRSSQISSSIIQRLVKDQVSYLKRRCTYITTDPCARYPACLCGQQIVENLLLELRFNAKPMTKKKPSQPDPSDPPPRTTPPDKRPAISKPVPQEFELTDARSAAWKGDRRLKIKE